MKKRAFTLVELLVVIAIIALLVAIILPSLSQAKDQAKAVKCLVNTKSFVQAFVMYAEDNDGYIVGGRFEGPPENGAPGTAQYWDDILLADYMSDAIASNVCPVAGDPPNPNWNTGGPTWGWGGNNEVRRGYGMNWYASAYNEVFEWNWGVLFYNAHKEAGMLWERLYAGSTRSSVPLVFDCGWWSIIPVESDIPNPNTEWTGGLGWMQYVAIDRHFEKVNVAMADMSSQPVALTDLWSLRWHALWSPRYDIDVPWVNR